MKKHVSLFLGAIALSAVALLISGCEQPAGDSGPAASTSEVIQAVHIVQYTPPVVGLRAPASYASKAPGATIIVALSQEHYLNSQALTVDNFKVSIEPGTKAPGYKSQQLAGVTTFTGTYAAPSPSDDNKFTLVTGGDFTNASAKTADPNPGAAPRVADRAYWPAVYVIRLQAEIEDGQVISVKFNPGATGAVWGAEDPVTAKSATLDEAAHILGAYTGSTGAASPNYIDLSTISGTSGSTLIRKGETDQYDTITPALSNLYGSLTFAQVFGPVYEGTAEDFVLYRVQTSPAPLVERITTGVTPDAAGVLAFPRPPEGTEGYYVYNGGTSLSGYGSDAEYDTLKPSIKIEGVQRAATDSLILQVTLSEQGTVYYAQVSTVAQDGTAASSGSYGIGSQSAAAVIDVTKLSGADDQPAVAADARTGQIAVTIKDRAGNWGNIDSSAIGKLIPAPASVSIAAGAGGSAVANNAGQINLHSIKNGVTITALLNGGPGNIGTAGDDMYLVLTFTDRYGKVVEIKQEVNVAGSQAGTPVTNTIGSAADLRLLQSLAETGTADTAIALTAKLQGIADEKLTSLSTAAVNVYKDTIQPRMTAVARVAADKAAIVWNEPISALGTPGTFNGNTSGLWGSAAVTPTESRALIPVTGTLTAGSTLEYVVTDATAGFLDAFNNPAQGFPATTLSALTKEADFAAAYALTVDTDYTYSSGTFTLTDSGNTKIETDGALVIGNGVTVTFGGAGDMALDRLEIQPGGTLLIPASNSPSVTINTGGALVNNGVIDLEDGGTGGLVVTGAVAGTPVTGTGVITSGDALNTTLTGNWSVIDDTGTYVFTGDSGLKIVGASSTNLTAADATAKIEVPGGATLTLGANAVVNLGSTTAGAAVGKILLAKGTSVGTLDVAATTAFVKTGLTATANHNAAVAFAAAGSSAVTGNEWTAIAIDTNNLFDISSGSSLLPKTTGTCDSSTTGTAGYLVEIAGAASTNSLKGKDSVDDGWAEVSGATATEADVTA
jgi:hypothetical protein